MGLKLQVELIQYDEDGDVTELDIEDAIINQAARTLANQCKDAVIKAVTEETRQQIADTVQVAVKEQIEKGFQPTDTYGSPKGERTTFAELMVKEVDKALTCRVGYNGNYDTYGKETMVQWSARQAAEACARDVIAKHLGSLHTEFIGRVNAILESKVANP